MIITIKTYQNITTIQTQSIKASQFLPIRVISFKFQSRYARNIIYILLVVQEDSNLNVTFHDSL